MDGPYSRPLKFVLPPYVRRFTSTTKHMKPNSYGDVIQRLICFQNEMRLVSEMNGQCVGISQGLLEGAGELNRTDDLSL